MTNKKSLKSALLLSGVSLLLSGAMLVGTTFAWFHDTAESAENTITAGTLDVDLEYNSASLTDAADENWKSAKDNSIFKDEDTKKWEPGKMVFSYPIRIANKGTKALKYKITVNITNDSDKLSEVIQSAVTTYPEGGPTSVSNRADAWTQYQGDDQSVAKENLNGGANGAALAVVLYWQPSASDDTYNFESGKHSFDINIDVYATQASAEKDTFGDKYDDDNTIETTEVPTATKTKESWEVKEAVDTGVTDVNTYAPKVAEAMLKNNPDEPENQWKGELTVSPLNYNAENDKYEAEIAFKGMNQAAVLAGIPGIVGLLHNAVVEQKDNIQEIRIGEKISGVDKFTTVTSEDIQGLKTLQDTDGRELDWENDPVNFASKVLSACLSSYPTYSKDGGPGWLLAPLLAWAGNYGVGVGQLFGGQLKGLDTHACDVIIIDKLGNAVTYSLEFAVQDA